MYLNLLIKKCSFSVPCCKACCLFQVQHMFSTPPYTPYAKQKKTKVMHCKTLSLQIIAMSVLLADNIGIDNNLLQGWKPMKKATLLPSCIQ